MVNILYDSVELEREILLLADCFGWKALSLNDLESHPKINDEFEIFISDKTDIENIRTLKRIQSIKLIYPISKKSPQKELYDFFSSIQRSDGLTILIPSSPEVSQVLFESQKRHDVITEIGSLFQSKGCFSEFHQLAMTISSELITNAFYNAPQDHKGVPFQTNRRVPVTMSKEHPVQVQAGDDGKYLWVLVEDNYGSLNKDVLVDVLFNSAKRTMIKVNEGPGGAGIGLFLIYNWASQLVFNLDPGKNTQILVKLLKTPRRKIFDSERAMFGILQDENQLLRIAAD